jgi:aerobic-type carbon monoxide dehydrogenase small subunit (CoxS/CutS family)
MTIAEPERSEDMLEGPVDGDGQMTLTLRVNGRQRRVKARSHQTVLEVLRRELKLFGVPEGYGVGMCGAWTVLVDGKPVSGCLLLASLVEGKDILTIEGWKGRMANCT